MKRISWKLGWLSQRKLLYQFSKKYRNPETSEVFKTLEVFSRQRHQNPIRIIGEKQGGAYSFGYDFAAR
jgi:hypothetical protein